VGLLSYFDYFDYFLAFKFLHYFLFVLKWCQDNSIMRWHWPSIFTLNCATLEKKKMREEAIDKKKKKIKKK